MTLHPKNQWEIPEQTAQIACASFPKGNMYMKMYDELGVLYADREFTILFPARCGQSAMSPGKLALITVMQFAEGLTDRQAADAVRSRIDWKYALGLELTDSGFDCSVLSEFRSRLCEYGLANKLLDLMLVRFQEKKLIKHRGKQRTRYFGLAKTHLQHIATACAINLSRFFAWSNHVTKARTRISSFARLNIHFT